MGTSNRVALQSVIESTLGTTPTTPRMRSVRYTGESLTFAPDYVDSEEIRSDRMLSAPIKVMQSAAGGINFELSYPVNNSPMSDFLRSAFYSTWVNTPERDNDGTADSIITDVASGAGVFTVLTGAAFVAGQLIKTTGFTNSGNNSVFKITTGSATVPAVGASFLTAEAAPAAAARIKVVGFQGAAGDIAVVTAGLTSVSLDFTTLGLAVGMWLKVGGTATADKFASAADNDWVRITAISANTITVDNKPTGWTADNGSGKTIKVWFGDYIQNGVTMTSLTLERGFMDQTTPTYIVQTGMVVNTFEVTMTSKQKINCSVTFTGMGGSQGTVALDASVDANTTGLVMAANANVGRVAENGSTLTSPNWAREFKLNINNNNRALEAIDSSSPVGINSGECTVTGTIDTYFGDNVLMAKMYAGTPSAINSRVSRTSQALIFQVPFVTYRGGGNPQATGKNQDVMCSMEYTGSIDTTLLSKAVQLDRIEFFE